MKRNPALRTCDINSLLGLTNEWLCSPVIFFSKVILMSEIFSYKWLAGQLESILKSHGLYSFESGPNSGVLLRHDVDFDVVPALELAEIQSGLGIKGTLCR